MHQLFKVVLLQEPSREAGSRDRALPVNTATFYRKKKCQLCYCLLGEAGILDADFT